MLSLLWMFVLHLAAVTGSNNAMAAVVSSLFLSSSPTWPACA